MTEINRRITVGKQKKRRRIWITFRISVISGDCETHLQNNHWRRILYAKWNWKWKGETFGSVPDIHSIVTRCLGIIQEWNRVSYFTVWPPLSNVHAKPLVNEISQICGNSSIRDNNTIERVSKIWVVQTKMIGHALINQCYASFISAYSSHIQVRPEHLPIALIPDYLHEIHVICQFSNYPVDNLIDFIDEKWQNSMKAKALPSLIPPFQ